MSYYQILQIHPQATQQEIKQSYRRLAKLFHPDTRTPSANKNKIIELNTAYEILGNPQHRRKYDYEIKSGFDDQLLEDFQNYLEQCSDYLQLSQQKFSAYPNPPQLANVAANLYYCLNHLGDGIKELEWFPLNYDEHYLHTGQEIFRIAERLRSEASFQI